MDQIFALTDSRGRLSLQIKCKLPYENLSLTGGFFCYRLICDMKISEYSNFQGKNVVLCNKAVVFCISNILCFCYNTKVEMQKKENIL